MRRKHTKKLVPVAKGLRKDMTKEERRLWYGFLRDHPARFRRQSVLGRFIADFYCPSAKLVIELDGHQHYTAHAMIRDAERTAILEQHGLSVVRIPNSEVNYNFDGVCYRIDELVRRGTGG